MDIELRKLKATDMGKVCKVISAIGIDKFGKCLPSDFRDIKEDSSETGLEMLLKAVNVILSNMERAETEIMTFVSSVSGLDIKVLEDMSFADYGELVIRILKKDDFKDFFSQAMKLFNL